MVIARRGRETVVVPSWEIPAFAGMTEAASVSVSPEISRRRP